MDARSPAAPASEGAAEEVNPRIFRDGGWWGCRIPYVQRPEQSSIALFRSEADVLGFLKIHDDYTAEAAQANAAEAWKEEEQLFETETRR
jgi:hypothetical protein